MKRSRVPTVTALSIVLIVIVGTTFPGINVHAIESSALSVQDGMTLGVAVSNPLSESEANSAKDAGATWIRVDVGIATSVQQTYSIAQVSGLDMIGIVSYWVVDNPDSFTLQDWESAIQAVYSAYPKIRAWEIWNEPTCSKYQHGYMDGTPQRYFNILKVAYTVLKARDSTLTILGVGGAQLGVNGDLTFTATVFSLGGGAYMDALAIHAYPYQLNAGETWGYYQELWSEQLQQYAQFGKPLWITETGLRSDQASESDQSNYLSASYSFFKALGIRELIWYEITDDGVAGDFSVGSWGLLRNDLTPKQSYDTFRSLAFHYALTVTRRATPTNDTAFA